MDEIYEALALEDIRRACAVLRPVYDASRGADGYVSIEVSPTLAHDTAATIAEARRLFAALDLPNVMIKVPATPAGVPAVQELIAAGINVNVTLIFSLAQYEAVAEAYLAGLEARHAGRRRPGRVASVASFFVSRVDTAVDPLSGRAGARTTLAGKIANDNAKVAYARFQAAVRRESAGIDLAAAGARVQRPLWASTGTKNPAYPDTLYVDDLIGPHTVNTLPPATLDAFRDHGTVADTLTADVAASRARLARLAELGIDLEAITRKLQDDGVASFAQAFEGLMASISERRDELLARESRRMNIELGDHRTAVEPGPGGSPETAQCASASGSATTRCGSRTRRRSANRLGWLDSPAAMRTRVAEHRRVRGGGACCRLHPRRAARHGRFEPRPGGVPHHLRGGRRPSGPLGVGHHRTPHRARSGGRRGPGDRTLYRGVHQVRRHRGDLLPVPVLLPAGGGGPGRRRGRRPLRRDHRSRQLASTGWQASWASAEPSATIRTSGGATPPCPTSAWYRQRW